MKCDMSELEYPQNQTAHQEEGYRQYLLTIGLTSLISWIAWGIVLSRLDPYENTAMALSLFTISLFFALIGSFTLAGFWLRHSIGKNQVHYHHLTVSLRQGMLLSLCTLTCIGLLTLNLLRWWNGIIVLAIVVLLEWFLTSRR